MLEKDKVKKICEEYDIGEYISINKIPEGVLNENYILETTIGKYFIKCVREKAKDKLKMIYGVESFMKEKGIPAVAMLQTKSGNIFLEYGEQFFTLYPFIESDKRSGEVNDFYKETGEMLGKIHLIGNEKLPKDLELKQFKRPAPEIIIERLENYKRDIINKAEKDETDKKFLEYIDFKLNIIPKISEIILENDTLIHGDFHPGNLLIKKEARKIIGVCDWEKTEFGPRSFELGRSIFYSCFEAGYEINQALIDAKLFLEGYLSVFPIEISEIMDGLNMRIHRVALSSWIEEKYYKDHDLRANHFIENEMKVIDSFVNGNLSEKMKELATSASS